MPCTVQTHEGGKAQDVTDEDDDLPLREGVREVVEQSTGPHLLVGVLIPGDVKGILRGKAVPGTTQRIRSHGLSGAPGRSRRRMKPKRMKVAALRAGVHLRLRRMDRAGTKHVDKALGSPLVIVSGDN